MSTAGSSAAIYAVIANAIKACGPLVRVEPETFLEIVKKAPDPLIVRHYGGGLFFSKYYRYLIPYRGLVFHCRTKWELNLPSNVEIIQASAFSVPDL